MTTVKISIEWTITYRCCRRRKVHSTNREQIVPDLKYVIGVWANYECSLKRIIFMSTCTVRDIYIYIFNDEKREREGDWAELLCMQFDWCNMYLIHSTPHLVSSGYSLPVEWKVALIQEKKKEGREKFNMQTYAFILLLTDLVGCMDGCKKEGKEKRGQNRGVHNWFTFSEVGPTRLENEKKSIRRMMGVIV